MALAPSDRPWEGDLKGFFTSNPVVIPDQDPVPPRVEEPAEPGPGPGPEAGAAVDELYEVMRSAQGGDSAAEIRWRGLMAAGLGDNEGALPDLEARGADG